MANNIATEIVNTIANILANNIINEITNNMVNVLANSTNNETAKKITNISSHHPLKNRQSEDKLLLKVRRKY